jgi:hypothetical protein
VSFDARALLALANPQVAIGALVLVRLFFALPSAAVAGVRV